MCCIGIGKARMIKMLADQEAAQINRPHTREPATAQIKPSNNKHSSTEECETLPEESTASQSSSPTSSSESPNPGQPRKEETPQHLASNSSQTCSQGAKLSLEHQQASINHGLHHLSSHSPSHHLEAWPPLAACHLPQLPSTLNPSTSILWDQLTTLQHPNTFHIQTSITLHSHLPYLP